MDSLPPLWFHFLSETKWNFVKPYHYYQLLPEKKHLLSTRQKVFLFNEINPMWELWNALRAWNIASQCEMRCGAWGGFISFHISTSLLYNQFNKLEFGGEFRHAGFPALPPSQVRGARRLRRQCAKFQFEEQVLLRIKSLFLPAIRTILPFLYMKKAPVRALFSTKSTLTGEWNTASRCEIWLCHVKSLWRWVDFIAVKNGAVKKVPQQGSQCLKALATKN